MFSDFSALYLVIHQRHHFNQQARMTPFLKNLNKRYRLP